MNILGIWDGHDSGAALFVDGNLEAAINEERLSRRKLEVCFPRQSIKTCLEMAGLSESEIDVVACCTSDVAKTVGRLFPSSKESYYAIRRRRVKPGLGSRLKKRLKYRIAEWPPNRVSRRMSLYLLKRELASLGLGSAQVKIFDHHRCHAIGAALASGFKSCVVITIDGVGDGASASVSTYEDGVLHRLAETSARDSLGVLFEHVTNLMNMRELEDEGKVMALADHTFPIPDDENPCLGLIGVDGLKFKAAKPGHSLKRMLEDIQWHHPSEQFAYLAQRVVEQRMADLCKAAVDNTGLTNLALAGGVVSNVKGNRLIRMTSGAKNVFVFPHMGDGGLALGAGALAALRAGDAPQLPLDDLGLGPEYSDSCIREAMNDCGLKFIEPGSLTDEVADLIGRGAVVLWFQGRMEFGPRALGHRSVLARPDRIEIRDRMNLVLKRRAWFQPFCPSMLESSARELLQDYDGGPNRHMTMAYKVRSEKLDKMIGVVSTDGSCRPQMIGDGDSSRFAELLTRVKQRHGLEALLNTSFNIHGEPLACSPQEACDIFKRCGADALAIGSCLVHRVS